MEFDEHGKIVRKKHPGNDLGLSDTIVVDRDEGLPDPETLFDLNDKPIGTKNRKARKAKATRKSRRKTRKR